MDILLIVALALFLVQIIAWIALPASRSVGEFTAILSSIGDEVKESAAA